MNKDELSPKEKLFLSQLDKLYTESLDLTEQYEALFLRLHKAEQEIAELKREKIILQEENQHHREILQTLKERIVSILNKLE